MKDEKTIGVSGASHPGGLAALQELVDDLISVDLAGLVDSENGPLDAEFRVALQELVTAEMRRSDSTPDLAKIIAAALTKWASVR